MSTPTRSSSPPLSPRSRNSHICRVSDIPGTPVPGSGTASTKMALPRRMSSRRASPHAPRSPPRNWRRLESGLKPMRIATSSLIHGEVMHRRRRPVGNAFTYRSFCLALPLAQIGDLAKLGLAHNRRALVSFFDRDHGERDGSALEPWLRRLLAAENVVADGEIVLYAFPRMLGYVFN